jgi:hypothetical protein
MPLAPLLTLSGVLAGSPRDLIDRMFAAFNRHDVAAMQTL